MNKKIACRIAVMLTAFCLSLAMAPAAFAAESGANDTDAAIIAESLAASVEDAHPDGGSVSDDVAVAGETQITSDYSSVDAALDPNGMQGESERAGSQDAQNVPVETNLTVAEVALEAQDDPAAEPQAQIVYSAHVQDIGWQDEVQDGELAGTTGRALRMEAVRIQVEGEIEGGVQYRAHVQDIGWMPVVQDGADGGTSGRALRVEAIEISLFGELSRYFDVRYRVHVENIGWQDWRQNGEMAGTTGRGLRLEALNVELVRKEQPDEEASPGIVGLSYRTHVENVGWQDWVTDGATAGTTGQALRVEALDLQLISGMYEGSIECDAHVENIGWMPTVEGDGVAGTTGRALRVEAVKIRLTGEIAEHYDVMYRAHVQNIGWQPWTIDGATAGTTGRALRIEALQVKLVDKSTMARIADGTYSISIADSPDYSVSAQEADGSSSRVAVTLARDANGMADRFFLRNEPGGALSLQSVTTGLFLADDGGQAVLLEDAESDDRRWTAAWDGGFVLMNVATGLSLALSDSTPTVGAALVTAQQGQRWMLTAATLVEEGRYTITNVASGLVLDVWGASADDGTDVRVGTANNGMNQIYRIVASGDGVQIRTLYGKAVAVAGGSTAEGANVHQASLDGSASQEWSVELDRSGNIVFVNKASGKVLAAEGTQSGDNVTCREKTGEALQGWALTAARSTFKLFLNAGHGWGSRAAGEYDPGASGYGYDEADLTSDLCERILRICRDEYGLEVIDGRQYQLPYDQRLSTAIDLGCTAILSIHFNAGYDSGYMSMVGVSGRHQYSELFNSFMHSALEQAFPELPNNGVSYREDITCVNGNIPASLLEVCFIDSDYDMAVYDSRRDTVARKIAEAILQASMRPEFNR